MGPAVLGLLLGCLAIASAQEPQEEFAVLCENNNMGNNSYATPGSGCKTFVSCFNQDYRGTIQCPETTLFSENKQICDYEKEVDCLVPLDRNPDCVTGVVPYNCSAFTYCHLGTEYHFSCNQDLYYSESMHTCVYLNQLTYNDTLKCNQDNTLFGLP